MAKRGNTRASKLGYEDSEFTTIDGRKLVMGKYFKPEDFVLDDKNVAAIKHDGMQRVLFDLFDVKQRKVDVYQSPTRSNDWCAVVKVSMVVLPRVLKEGEADEYLWEAVADCRKGNAMPGMDRYTTANAETRASGRVIRRLLGLESFCTKEELAETTFDVDDDMGPAQDSQLLLIRSKFLGDPKNDITIEIVNKRLKRKEGEENYIKEDDDNKVWKEKLTVGQAADLIAKLHRYDIEAAVKE